MRIQIVVGLFAVTFALGSITPTDAVTVGGVDYVFLAKHAMVMANSTHCFPFAAGACLFIEGNIGVSDPAVPGDTTVGRLSIGANNIIANSTGTASATASQIVFGSFASVDVCRFDSASGMASDSVCGTVVTPTPVGTLPIFPDWEPRSGPLGTVAVDDCVNLLATPSVTVAAGTVTSLEPGCYKHVRVNAGGGLNLGDGDYTFRTLRLLAGADLFGAGQTRTTINVQELTITESGASIDNVTIATPGSPQFTVTQFIVIGNGNTLNNVTLYAPSSAIHLHPGVLFFDIEAVANFITLAPIQNLVE